MAVDVYSETGDIVVATALPAGARALGVRVKPILRLAMGHKHPEKGYPIKDDHFSPRGDDRAVSKFIAEYGDNPKAVEILLPSELEMALSIEYLAFRGGQNGDGGTLVARGQSNFAHRDYCGGPDILTVYHQDGAVEEIETAGLDANTREPLDEVAKEWGIELYTTLTAMMPGVLGFGSYFALTTKGKESTDNLWLKLRELYGLFGSKITFAVKPQLVIRSSTARPVVVKDGESKRISTTIYVADIVVPETIDEMIGRLQERQAALAPAGAAAALYGEPRALAAVPAVAPSAADVREAGQQAGAAGDAAVSAPGSGDEQIEDGVFEPVDDEAAEPSAEQFAAAAAKKVSRGAWAGKTFSEIADAGDEGAVWLLVQMKKLDPDDGAHGRALAVFLQGRLPETWQQYVAWKAAQS